MLEAGPVALAQPEQRLQPVAPARSTPATTPSSRRTRSLYLCSLLTSIGQPESVCDEIDDAARGQDHRPVPRCARPALADRERLAGRAGPTYPRRPPRGWPVTTVRARSARRTAAALAGAARGLRRAHRVRGRLRPAAARRRGARRRRLPRHRRVPRRARPGAAVGGQGQRRHRRARSRRSTLDGWHAAGDGAARGLGEAARQRGRRAAPDQPAGREVRVAQAARRRHRPRGRLGDGDIDPARPHRPQPGGRRGARRAVAGAQRRRRRPAAAPSTSSSTRPWRAASPRSRASSPASTRSSAASTSTRPRSSARSTGSTGSARRLAEQKDDIAVAIEDLGPGLTVLADQREELTTMLTALSELGRGRHPGDQRSPRTTPSPT